MMHELAFSPQKSRQRLHKMVVHMPTVRTRQTITIIAEEIAALFREDHQLMAVIAFKSVQTARIGCKNIVGIHGAKDEGSSLPTLQAKLAPKLSVPAFQTSHAHCTEVLQTTVHFYLLYRNQTTGGRPFNHPSTQLEIVLHTVTGNFKSTNNFSFSICSFINLTCRQFLRCCLGDKKKVPSIRGYWSNISMMLWHKTHVTRDNRAAAKFDKTKHLVSSLPQLPSSSIWNENQDTLHSVFLSTYRPYMSTFSTIFSYYYVQNEYFERLVEESVRGFIEQQVYKTVKL